MERRRLANFVDSQGLGALAFPCFTYRQQAKVLRNSSGATLADARLLVGLAEDVAPSALTWALAHVNDSALEASEKIVPRRLVELSRVFNTEQRLRQLRRALDRFDTAVQSWTVGELRDPRFSWVIPNRLAAAALTGQVTDTLRERLQDSGLGAMLLERAPHFLIWLSVLSLEGVIEIDRMRAADYPVLSLMISRGASSLGFHGKARPWLPRFPKKMQALPITWLYQFDPSPRAGTVLARLERGGLCNLGHLAVLHPEGFHWIRKTPPEAWRAVQLALKHPVAR